MGNLLPSTSRSIYPTITYCNNTFQPLIVDSKITLNPTITITNTANISSFLYTNATNTMSYLLFGPYISTPAPTPYGLTVNQVLQKLYPICYPYMNFITINGYNYIYVNMTGYYWVNSSATLASYKPNGTLIYPGSPAYTSSQNAISAISSYIPFTLSLK